MAASTPTTLSTNKRYFTGEDALHRVDDYIFEFEKNTLTSFVKVKAPKKIELPARCELASRRVFWEEHSSNEFPLAFDGVPFFVLGCQVRACCHGPDRHRASKNKAARIKSTSKVDHDYSGGQRNLVQTTKKLDCPARIHIRSIVRFPAYRIEENGEYGRKKTSKQLRADLQNSEDVLLEYRVYVALPPHDAHRNHLTQEVDAMTHNVDGRVIKKIHSLVDDGVRDIGEMKRHINSFSKTNFPGVPESSNRFFPNNRCLRNHMYAALSLSQFSTEDQENLQQHVTAWSNERPDDSFYFVPSPKEDDTDNGTEDFIFVHQTAWQRRLLSMYGNEICLLDATYCVCKCDVALFFICVSTNIGYITVGCFLLPSETIKNISRGLHILKQWNRDWSPSYFMTDYDQKEIAAIETTFPDCFTFLCDFHREQSWERWMKSSVSGVKKYKNELLQMMRNIAHADSEESFEDAVTSLKQSEYWTENEHLRVWFEKQWLSASKRWVHYHRQSLQNVRVTTTNGLERQHYELKQNYLKKYTEGTVTSLIKTITTQFLPDSFKRIQATFSGYSHIYSDTSWYRESNVKCLNTSRMYSDSVPHFLHDRPKLFREHCAKRLSSAMEIPLSDISILPGQKFEVISTDRSKTYVLDVSGSLPRCSCPDWKRYHLPCKHMLSILVKVPDCGWESLSEEFTNSPHFNVDRGVLNIVCTPARETASTSSLDSSQPMFNTPASTTAHTSQPEVDARGATPTPSGSRSPRRGTIAIGSRCKMLANSIQSMLHLVRDTSDYEIIYKDLMALHGRLRGLVPKEAGMLRRPPRLGRKPCQHGLLKQRRRYRKAQRKVVKRVRNVRETVPARPRVVPLDSTLKVDDPSTTDTARIEKEQVLPVIEESPAKEPCCARPGIVRLDLASQFDDPSTVTVDMDLEHVTDPLICQDLSSTYVGETPETVLQHLLSNPPSDRPIVQIGPYTITDSSMHYLNSTLSDEVIDACLYLLAKGDVFHVDCANMTAIFDTAGLQDSTSYLPRLQLQRYEALLGAVNEGGVHWVLMIIIPGAKRLVYMNPLGEQTAKIKSYEQRWCMFLRERCRRGIETDSMRPDGWKVEVIPHSKQMDGSSCGIYVIRFAEQYLSGRSEYVSLTKKNLQMERRRIQLKLLSRGIQEQDMLAVRMRQTTEDRKSEEYKEENGQHNETAETCRKRKRKDERKSSIFMYEIPKKSSRIPELKYCVCRKVNDGRKYWNCEDCMEWYHPECMGYKEEEEPDTYICPGCQVEKKKFWQKNCPSWSEVEEELMESLRIEEADPYDESHMGDLQETHRGLTAMCLNNPAVQFFLDTQRQKGKSIENKQTGWGPFILLDEEKLEEFFSFRSNVNVEELLAVSDALRYFMDKFGKNIKVMHVSENVVQMHPGHAVEKYKEWLKEMKEELSS